MQKFVKLPMKKDILKVCSLSAFLLMALFVQGQVLAASWTNIDGGVHPEEIDGGYAVGATSQSTSSNNVSIGPSGSFSGSIYGGYANSVANADAFNNNVSILGGSFTGQIHGACASTMNGIASAYNNTVRVMPSREVLPGAF